MTVHRPRSGWSNSITDKRADGSIHSQCAALCFRSKGKRYEFLLITSRDSGRWIVPKGWRIKNLTAAETAAREAFEEAGVVGQVGAQPIGTFQYEKSLGGGIWVPCRVKVFALEVRKLVKIYPEAHQRQRKWFGKKRASQKVQESELRELIAAFSD